MLNSITQEVPWGLTKRESVFQAGFIKSHCLFLTKCLNVPHTQVPKVKANTTERKQPLRENPDTELSGEKDNFT